MQNTAILALNLNGQVTSIPKVNNYGVTKVTIGSFIIKKTKRAGNVVNLRYRRYLIQARLVTKIIHKKIRNMTD